MKERFNYLLSRYADGSISLAEHDEFFDLLASGDYDAVLNDHFENSQVDVDRYDVPALPDSVNHEMIRNILASEKEQTFNMKKEAASRSMKVWFAAASIAVFTICSFYFISLKEKSDRFAAIFTKSSSVKQFNASAKPMSVVLPDGSDIVLQPKASIYFSSESFSSRREVYMEGEAYFKVAKNPARPFYVYYGKLVTKVLGTSFNIRTNHYTGNVEVEVLTGKVQVYENPKVLNQKSSNSGVILTPNQKAVYETEKGFFEPALIKDPQPITVIDDENSMRLTAVEPANFNFENERLSDVLEKISKAYGIDIIVSNENVYRCVFSGNITKQNLYDKLKIVSVATGTSYEVSGTTILIKGNGCKEEPIK